jgi:primosomal protein N' (replication factor Y) (superfamily II helicase)
MHVTARVLIDGPSELVFDYAIPAGLDVRPGCRVRVPLRRKSATGTVLGMGDAAAMGDFALRELESLVDPEPLVTPVLLRMADWIAQYYGSSIESVIRSILPESVRTEDHSAKTRRIAVLTRDLTDAEWEKVAKRAPRQHAVMSMLRHAAERRLAVADLGEGTAPAIKALAAAGLITVETEECGGTPRRTVRRRSWNRRRSA